MKHTGATLRFIIITSIFLQAGALKVESGSLPTQLIPQQHPQISKSTGLSAAVAAEAHLSPVSKTSTILPAPTISCCIVFICFEFVVVYTALALCRTYHELTSSSKGKLEAALRAAAQTLTCGPMLCVLFVACDMWVRYLSNGKDEPQAWVQSSMCFLTFATLLSTLLVLVIQLIIGRPLQAKESPFDLERGCQAAFGRERSSFDFEKGTEHCKVTFYTLTIVRYFIVLAMYGALAAMIFGTCTYLPAGARKLSDVEAPAPAIICTMVLAVVFFSTQLVVAVCRTFSELTRVDFPQIVGMMHAGATTVEFAPMLAVLFLAAHMRALQHDAQPEDWVSSCMFASTGAMCVTTLLAIVVPLTLGGTLKRNPWTHEVVVEVPKPALGYVFIALRYLCLLCFYGGAAGVIASIYVFESPGPKVTSPVSPTLQCVVNLTCQFFFVYFVMTLMLTVSEVTGGIIPIEKWTLFPAIEAARTTLAFAPMLSIICVTTRMHALMITDKLGAPAVWVQDGMYLATWSLQVSGFMCLATGLFMAKTRTDFDGKIVNKFTNRFIGFVILAVRFISTLLLYGGMVMVIVGLFTMTPESANGRGAVSFVASASASRIVLSTKVL